MSFEADLFAVLAPLVSNRVHAVTFPQQQSVPITPAILFTFISDETNANVCGSDEESTANTRVQIDIYSTTFDSTRALRIQVLGALETMSPPVMWDGGFSSYEPDLKLHRSSLDAIRYPSSV